MRKKYPLALFVVLFFGFFIREVARPSRLEAARLKYEINRKAALLDPAFSQFIEDYESFLWQQLEEEGVPGAAVAIIKDNTIALIRPYGARSAGSGKPVDLHTIFRVASLSKGFTGMLAGMMVEKGALSWEEPVREHVPGFRLKSEENTRNLQLQHVLSHTTGLPRHTFSNLLNMGVKYDKILSMLPGVEVTHPVGVYHNYQNVAFSLAGDVMEDVSGQSFAQLLENHIFGPLGMKDASADYDTMRLASNVALPHKRIAAGYTATEVEPDFYEVVPAAGVNASISDMAKWLQALMGNRPEIVSDSLLNQVFRPFVEIPRNDRVLRNWHGLQSAHYGMGWRILKTREGMEVIQHSGYVNGYRAEIAFSRQGRVGIVLLTNAPNYTVGHAIPAFFEQYLESCQQNDAVAQKPKRSSL